MVADKLLGEEGEGSVYSGKWHGKPAAFKAILFKGDTIDGQKVMTKVQESLKEIYSVIDMMMAINDEAKKTGKPLSKSHVLCPLAHFQQSFGGIIYDIFVYPLCKGGDLSNYMVNAQPTGEILNIIFLQISVSVRTLSKYGKKHNDIKLSNFLVVEEDKGLNVYLTDFGFMDNRLGGTPLFASPECNMREQPAVKNMFTSSSIICIPSLPSIVNIDLGHICLPS